MLKLNQVTTRFQPKMLKLTELATQLKLSRKDLRVRQLVRTFLPDRVEKLKDSDGMWILAHHFYRRFFPLELGQIIDEAMESGTEDVEMIEVDYFDQVRIAAMGIDPETVMYSVDHRSSLISYACLIGDITEHRAGHIDSGYAATIRAMHGEELEMNDKLGELITDLEDEPFKLEEIRAALEGTRHERFTEVMEYVLGVPENRFLRKNQENTFGLGSDGPWEWDNILRLKTEWDEGHRLHARVYNASATWDAVLEKHMYQVLTRLRAHREQNNQSTEVLE